EGPGGGAAGAPMLAICARPCGGDSKGAANVAGGAERPGVGHLGATDFAGGSGRGRLAFAGEAGGQGLVGGRAAGGSERFPVDGDLGVLSKDWNAGSVYADFGELAKFV